MTKKGHQKMFRIKNFFSGIVDKSFWGDQRRATPPTKIDRSAAADTMASAHSSKIRSIQVNQLSIAMIRSLLHRLAYIA